MAQDLKAKLAELKTLLDDGLVEQADFDLRRRALLDGAFGASDPSSGSGGGVRKRGTEIALTAGMVLGPQDRRYRLESALGSGGMGEVWKADDLSEAQALGRPSWKALKILPAELAEDPNHRKWLKEEAIAASHLGHPHIVRVFDWREDSVSARPFIVMECLEGRDLNRLLAEEGNPGLSYERVMELVEPVAQALTYAWERHGLVHRDIKPGNVFVTKSGEVRLLDFGIAARVRRTSSILGLDGRESAGTPGYRAPEAGARQKPTPRLDVYSLGVLVYELLEGEAPFEGMRTRDHEPQRPSALNDAQWAVIQRAMAYDSEARQESAVALIAALREGEGPSEEESKRHEEEELWAEACSANTVESYENYCIRTQFGFHRAGAQARIAAIRARMHTENLARKRAEEERETEVRRREEEVLWRRAVQVDTLEGFDEYLAATGIGKYRDDALARKVELQAILTTVKRDGSPPRPALNVNAVRDEHSSPSQSNSRWSGTVTKLLSGGFGIVSILVLILVAAELLRPKPESPKVATAVAPPPSIEIKIGSVAALTGGIASLGKDNENGVRLAVDQANAAKIKIDGKDARFLMMGEDDQADPKVGTTVAQKLVDAKVAGVVGHLNSGTSIPASSVYSRAGIPVISGSATNPKLTEQGFKVQFRVIGRDDQQGPAIARYLATNNKPKVVAVIDDATAYGEGLANEVEKTLKAAKIDVLPRLRGTDKTTDWKAVLTKVKGKLPDAVFYGGMDATGGPLMKQGRELGIKALFAFGDGACTDDMSKLAGDAAEGLLCSQAGIPAAAADKRFLDAYKAKFNVAPILYAPFTYDAANMLIESMRRANSAEPAKYLPELAKLRFSGATGKIEFDEKGDRKNAEMTIFTMKGGKIEPIAIVKATQLIPYVEFVATLVRH